MTGVTMPGFPMRPRTGERGSFDCGMIRSVRCRSIRLTPLRKGGRLSLGGANRCIGRRGDLALWSGWTQGQEAGSIRSENEAEGQAAGPGLGPGLPAVESSLVIQPGRRFLRAPCQARRSRPAGGWARRESPLALAVCGAVCVAARKYWPQESSGLVRVVGRVSLSPRHSIYLVRAGQRILLIGTGTQGAPALLGESGRGGRRIGGAGGERTPGLHGLRAAARARPASTSAWETMNETIRAENTERRLPAAGLVALALLSTGAGPGGEIAHRPA